MKATKPTTIRQLQPGDPVPTGEPRRYANKKGYVRLRWKVAPYEYIEVYEHRLVVGLPPGHVHHKNEVKGDNRGDNLRRVTRLEHGEEHSRINFTEAAALYESGWSLPQLSDRYGVHNSSVMRFLKKRGVQMRTLSESWRFRRTA